MTVEAGPDARALYRVGGISGIAVAVGYLVITPLYLLAGTVPSGGGEAWLLYLDGKTVVWWAITGLSVLTDVLYLPVAAALYVALNTVSRTQMLAGTTLLALFVVLDLAVTWTNYAALITLSADYATLTDDAERAHLLAAATYVASVLSSSLFPVYVILIPALGALLIGLVILRGAFSRTAGYLGVVTGILGVVAVLGAYVWPSLSSLYVLTAVLTLVWFLIVGYRLLRLA
jgi:hypothetical protein